MRYQEFLAELLPVAGAELAAYGATQKDGVQYPLIALHAGAPELIIFTGFHGDEPTGPMSMLKHLAEVFAHAQSRQVGLRVYPCANPVGFSEGHRYSGDQKQTNYIFQYQLADGTLTGELAGKKVKPVGVVPREKIPEEIAALAVDLAHLPKPIGVLDIHQDGSIKVGQFYFYAYNTKAPFLQLAQQCGQLGAPVKSGQVSQGGDIEPRKTDADGFITDWHDGSFTDWYCLQEVPLVLTLETAAATPFDLADQVNLVAMREMIDLVAKTRGTVPAVAAGAIAAGAGRP